MKRTWVCHVCGYYWEEEETASIICPICKTMYQQPTVAIKNDAQMQNFSAIPNLSAPDKRVSPELYAESSNCIPNSNRYAQHRKVISQMSRRVAEYVAKTLAAGPWSRIQEGAKGRKTFAVIVEKTDIRIQYRTVYKFDPFQPAVIEVMDYSSFAMGNVFDTNALMEALAICLKVDFPEMLTKNFNIPGVQVSGTTKIVDTRVWIDFKGYVDAKEIELALSYHVKRNPNLVAW